ncbi:MAG TPA: hypothetical protein V6D03_07965 [Candidatus Caenarcaniphilales bacterium]
MKDSKVSATFFSQAGLPSLKRHAAAGSNELLLEKAYLPFIASRLFRVE